VKEAESLSRYFLYQPGLKQGFAIDRVRDDEEEERKKAREQELFGQRRVQDVKQIIAFFASFLASSVLQKFFPRSSESISLE